MLAIAALGALAISASSVRADLGKATLFDNGLPFPELDSLPTPTAQVVSVAVPDICTSHATDNNCDLSAVEAFQVTYSDCAEPWTLCRCGNAEITQDVLVANFGRVPPGVRSYVGSALAVEAGSCSAGSGGDFIVFSGSCVEAVYIHESGHSLDQNTSPSQAWTDALSASTCVPDAYADTSVAEDFAQVNVVYTYQTRVGALPDGADPACMQPQLNVFSGTARLADAHSATTCNPDVRPFQASSASAAVERIALNYFHD